MHVSTKRLAFSGVLLAITVLLVALSSIVEMSTLFFLAAASYLVGVNFRESGARYGVGFFMASLLLSFIVAPNKLYCVTFGAISCYIVTLELIRIVLTKRELKKLAHLNHEVDKKQKGTGWFYGIKYVVFNILYLPILFFFPKLMYTGEIETKFTILFLIGGQVAFLLYDMGYDQFVGTYWARIKRSVRL